MRLWVRVVPGEGGTPPNLVAKSVFLEVPQSSLYTACVHIARGGHAPQFSRKKCVFGGAPAIPVHSVCAHCARGGGYTPQFSFKKTSFGGAPDIPVNDVCGYGCVQCRGRVYPPPI